MGDFKGVYFDITVYKVASLQVNRSKMLQCKN